MTACLTTGQGAGSPGASEVPRKLVPSGLRAAHFPPLQGEREDETADRSPEAEGGGEGSRDRAEEGPHRSDCASGVRATEGLAGGGAIQVAWDTALRSLPHA